jgi:DNA repair protein RecO (recombination protein O)
MREVERSIRVDAVVLRHAEWGEADRLLTLFSKEQGRLRAIAKGVRKPASRKAGHLQPFTRCTLQLARGHDLWIVTQADTLESYQPLRDELLLTGYASYVIELVDRLIYEEGQNPQLYSLLIDTLTRLSGGDAYSAVRYYELRLLDLLGYRPQLTECAHCGRKIEAQDQYFSNSLGGVICPECGLQVNDARPVSMRVLKFLRHYQRTNASQALQTPIPLEIREDLEGLVQNYLTYLLERRLNTPEFIRRVR